MCQHYVRQLYGCTELLLISVDSLLHLPQGPHCGDSVHNCQILLESCAPLHGFDLCIHVFMQLVSHFNVI